MSLSGEVRKTAEATLKRSSPKRRGYLVSDSPDEELPRAAELAAPAPESVKPKRKRRRSIISRSQDNLAQHEEAECHSDAEESDRARKGTGDSGFAKRKKKRPAFDAGQVTNATLESSADRRESPSSGGSEHPTVKEETGANSVDQASPQQPAGPARQLTLLTWMKSPLANGTKVAAPPRRTRRANAVSSRGSLSRSGGKTKRQSTLAAGGTVGTLTCTGTEKEKTKNPASRAAVDSGARKEQEKRTKKSRRRPVAVKGEAQSARANLTNRSRQSRGRNKEDGRKKKKCHEKTPMELKLLGEKRLTNFRCADAARYPVGDEWIMEIEGERGSFLNVNKILNPTSPDNYTEFVQSVLSLRDEGQALPNDERLTSQQILDLQKAVKRQPDPNKKTLDVKIDGTEYRFTDDVGRLAGESAELTPLAAEVKRRVVFTPSKGRSNAALLSWNGDASPRSTMQQVLLVPRSEHDAYAGLWAGQWLVVSTENDTIGAARHHIIKLARFWKLDDLWMIDDSVPTTQFYRTSLMDPPRQLLGSSPGSLPCICESDSRVCSRCLLNCAG
eukprot:scpid35339/ scgid15718/ 